MDKAIKSKSKSMSKSISIRHSMRPEALRAKSRITEYCKIDMTNSDSDESTTIDDPIAPITPAPTPLSDQDKANYKYTSNVIRYLVNECNNATFEDQRSQIVQKMFEHLNKNPTILIYEPKFRRSVINKLKEFEDYINTRVDDYNNAKYRTIINNMKISINHTMRNKAMVSEVNKYLNAINVVFTEYEEWYKGRPLMNQIKLLYHTLERIKKDPSYVDDLENTY
jgi:hypothetical protein